MVLRLHFGKWQLSREANIDKKVAWWRRKPGAVTVHGREDEHPCPVANRCSKGGLLLAVGSSKLDNVCSMKFEGTGGAELVPGPHVKILAMANDQPKT